MTIVPAGVKRFTRPLSTPALALLLLVATSAGSSVRAQEPASPAALSEAWQSARVVKHAPALLDHAAVSSHLSGFVKSTPRLFWMEETGRSVEDRSIWHVWFGHGSFHVLLWSQMHGDESTATAVLLDMLEYVRLRRDEPAVRRILDNLTVHVVPMLNPDGAARFQRRNAQGIDVNRDALLLQTPEGRLLKALRDRLQPSLGFNLHNQGWGTSVGKSGKPASVSLLAVSSDEAQTDTPGRVLAKKTCAVIRDALEALAPGRVAKYDETFEMRAFGDNIARWGTPVVLIETGPYAGDNADQELARLNFVAILTALDALASGRAQQADPARYETLPENESGILTILIRNAAIATGTGVAPFTGDVGLASARVIREPSPGMRELVQAFRVEDLGDLRVLAGLETVDATGLVVVPSQGWTEGALVSVPDWTKFQAARPLAVRAEIDLALLRDAGKGTYKVVRVFPAQRVLERLQASGSGLR